MAGTAGHSGRRPRKTVADHVLAGTFRRDRHARPAPLAFPGAPPVPDALIAGLGDAGRAYVEALWTEYDFSTAQRQLLRIAAECVDRRAAAAAALAVEPMVVQTERGPTQNPWLRIEHRATATLLDAERRMNLESPR